MLSRVYLARSQIAESKANKALVLVLTSRTDKTCPTQLSLDKTELRYKLRQCRALDSEKHKPYTSFSPSWAWALIKFERLRRKMLIKRIA